MNNNATHLKNIGLHIGLPKTGTTSLQLNCFSRHPELAYFGQTNFRQNKAASNVLRALLGGGSGEYNALAKRAIDDAFFDKPALMISDEAMTMGQFMVRAKDWPINTNHARNAARAKALLGNAHVFIVLRNQVDWLISWHRQGLSNGKYVTHRFDEWLSYEMGDHISKLKELLNYADIYSSYCNAFGSDYVHIYCYESFSATTFGDLAANITAKLGVDPRYSKVSMGHRMHNATKQGYVRQTSLAEEVMETRFDEPSNSLRTDLLAYFRHDNKILFDRLRFEKIDDYLSSRQYC